MKETRLYVCETCEAEYPTAVADGIASVGASLRDNEILSTLF